MEVRCERALPISIATGLNLSRAEVHGVISFYHDFKTHSVGRNTVQICRAEACQSMGSRQLEAHAKQALAEAEAEAEAMHKQQQKQRHMQQQKGNSKSRGRGKNQGRGRGRERNKSNNQSTSTIRGRS